jgi:putative hemolysin
MLTNEIAQLPAACHILSSGNNEVYCANADQIPNLLLEIGRLRELAFRTIKGPGAAEPKPDLDPYDQYYAHLFVWNNQNNEIISACRLGLSDVIIKKTGIQGLYTTSLFHLTPTFFEQMGPALEFGRTFVRAEWQKSYAPLLLLLKGIFNYVVKNPHYRCLFGLISLSQSYQLSSQAVITHFFENKVGFSDLSIEARPHHPVKFSEQSGVQDIADLSRRIKELESGLRSMPILVKEYLKFNTKLVSYGRDPAFGDCLDLLCIADLAHSNIKMLARYMGDEAQSFLNYPSEVPA